LCVRVGLITRTGDIPLLAEYAVAATKATGRGVLPEPAADALDRPGWSAGAMSAARADRTTCHEGSHQRLRDQLRRGRLCDGLASADRHCAGESSQARLAPSGAASPLSRSLDTDVARSHPADRKALGRWADDGLPGGAPEAEHLVARGALREHVHHDRQRSRQDHSRAQPL